MRQLTPEQLHTALEIAGGIAYAMTEAGKKELASLTALKAEVDAKLEAVGGLEKAEKVKAEADAYARDVRAEANDRADGVKMAAKSAQELQARAENESKVSAAERAALNVELAKHATDKANWAAGVEEQERRLALKEAGLKAQAEALERDRKILAEREQKFGELVKSLQTVKV